VPLHFRTSSCRVSPNDFIRCDTVTSHAARVRELDYT
jgi:hypothetical protein